MSNEQQIGDEQTEALAAEEQDALTYDVEGHRRQFASRGGPGRIEFLPVRLGEGWNDERGTHSEVDETSGH